MRAVGKSGCDALVVVMESADLGDFRNPPSIGGLQPVARAIES